MKKNSVLWHFRANPGLRWGIYGKKQTGLTGATTTQLESQAVSSGVDAQVRQSVTDADVEREVKRRRDTADDDQGVHQVYRTEQEEAGENARTMSLKLSGDKTLLRGCGHDRREERFVGFLTCLD